MSILDSDNIEVLLKPIVENCDPISIRIYELTDTREFGIQLVLEQILFKYNKLNLHTTLYTCVKELVINGLKANLKTVFFEENNWNIDNEDEYKKGIEIYKKKLGQELSQQYSKAMVERKQYVELNFDYTSDGLVINVVNTTPINVHDEAKMREKLRFAMGVEDLAEFYINHGDDTDGAGIGIALIILLLKGENLDPSLFRIGVKEGKTMARLEIPFTTNYLSVR